eukprot:CAMPEP_0167744984 /NCGR_PEP_ID=MMETSP0110_2-20121227/2898_1 /TAXON_ID=629695 /ORGANISM="Gymnochlora sp., Strain CCMP2014" /LENGTH=846 /DNA_ID=CAMNT_0007629573 /DNA_START=53 /DNA_END=2590 /DNA_ORIENTATION=+
MISGRLPARSPLFVNELCKRVSVVLVTGGTGSGKSSQVPQILADCKDVGHPILCTQPRRLAAVSIARRVAKERGAELGGSEVGYHIGLQRLSTYNTKIVFATCGLVLEQLRCEGLKAFERYKCIIIDEVHERSVESDLVLACAKLFLRNRADFRLVLMSATANVKHFKDYFNDGPRKNFSVVSINNLGTMIRSHISNTRINVNYLRHAIDYLPRSKQNMWKAFLDPRNPEVVPLKDAKGKKVADNYEGKLGINGQHLLFCVDLVLAILSKRKLRYDEHLRHRKHSDRKQRNFSGGGILIFMPTYKAIENLHKELKIKLPQDVNVFGLHSSIDVNECCRRINEEEKNSEEAKGNIRVIISTSIAESSVTIPDVGYVIDFCRQLQVSWDSEKRITKPNIVWASRSQSNQRKGRTGRTCPGTVFRIVTHERFLRFQNYETPSIQLSNLRWEILLLSCSKHRLTRDINKALGYTVDPPQRVTKNLALRHLKKVGFLDQKFRPTLFGRFAQEMPCDLSQTRLLLLCMKNGVTSDGTILAGLLTNSPMPVARIFGQDEKYFETLRKYSPIRNAVLNNDGILLANKGALKYWQDSYMDIVRTTRMAFMISGKDGKELKEGIFDGIPFDSAEAPISKDEEKWARERNFTAVAFRRAIDTGGMMLNIMHRYRPVPFIKDIVNEEREERKTATLLKRILCGSREVAKIEEGIKDKSDLLKADITRPQCIYYVMGVCSKGIHCRFSHSELAIPPLCKFIKYGQTCAFGEGCLYSHNKEEVKREVKAFDYKEELDYNFDLKDPTYEKKYGKEFSVKDIYANETVLVVGVKDLSFSTEISRQMNVRNVTTKPQKTTQAW